LGFGEPCEVACYKYSPGPRYQLETTFTVSKETPECAAWAIDISPNQQHLIVSANRQQIFSTTLKLPSDPSGEHAVIFKIIHSTALLLAKKNSKQIFFSKCIFLIPE
jgi:hypothetical protein